MEPATDWKNPEDKPLGRVVIPFEPPSDRLPPQNLDAERGALAACMMDAEALIQVVDMLSPMDFYREAHAVVYRAILGLVARNVAVDAVTVADELTSQGVYKQIGGDDALAEICNSIPHAANARYHADIVRQKAAVREFIQSRTDEIREAYSNTSTAGQLLVRATDNLESIEKTLAWSEEDFDDSNFKPWPVPDYSTIWHGVAGKLVREIEPHSESDPMAVLGQFLVCIGNMVGRKPHWYYESTRHSLNLYLCVVGESSKARKGTSWNHVLHLLHRADEQWTKDRVLSGLSTGEGLIHQVRDPLTKRVKVGGDYEEREIDAGVQDKRALFVESEFGGLLTTMGRDGYNTSSVIRQAWESGNLSIANKNTPVRATGAHISIIGHITSAELHGRLTNSDAANGFANRFLWVCARRSKMLPHGGKIQLVDFRPYVAELQEVMVFVDRALDESVPLLRDAWANQLWEHEYARLTEAKPGLLGAIVSRAEPQVMRIASIYAVLDQSTRITETHLKAALAFWRYCEQSAAWIFGDVLGDPDAEAVLKALREAGSCGLTRTQINRRAFSGHKPAAQLEKTLVRLVRSSLVEPPSKEASDRPRGRPRAWTLKNHLLSEPARFARAGGPEGATQNDATS